MFVFLSKCNFSFCEFQYGMAILTYLIKHHVSANNVNEKLFSKMLLCWIFDKNQLRVSYECYQLQVCWLLIQFLLPRHIVLHNSNWTFRNRASTQQNLHSDSYLLHGTEKCLENPYFNDFWAIELTFRCRNIVELRIALKVSKVFVAPLK